jgi:Ethylbenzene dehydrogenase
MEEFDANSLSFQRNGNTLNRIILFVFVALLLGLLPFLNSSPFLKASAQSFPNIISYRVAGSPNYTSPGNESFWKAINWTNVPLSASVSPGGGHTPNLLVKSANNGFDIYMLFRWNDTAGPAYLGSTEAFKAANGSLVDLTPELTANITQLYYNSTYYYPDRIAMLLFIAPSSLRQQAPVMMLGTNGAIKGGAAEIWHWQANPTDNSPNDTGFPGGYTDPTGNPIYPPDNLSFAEDDYTNTTGFFVVAGNFGNSTPNLDPYADPFVVHVGSSYSYSNKTWTVEMVRAFQTSDASSYRAQLKTGSPFYVALAVWQGKLGESSNLKSVSQWLTLTISNSGAQSEIASTTTTNVSGEVSVPLAAAVAAAVLIAGLVIGTIIRSPSGAKNKS